MLKNPWFSEASATDCHAIGPGFFQKTNGVDSFADATAAEHWYRDGPFHTRDNRPIGSADA